MGRGGAKKKDAPVDTGPELPKIDGDIFKLAAMKNLQLVRALVEREEDPVDVNSLDELECSPLTWASRAADPDLIEYLIENGADKDHAAYGGLRPIHHCANVMSEACVKVLIEAGAQVDATDESGNTVLHFIAARGVLSMIVLVTDNGANIDTANATGTTPFHKACNNGQLSSVQKLTELGANVNAQDQDGNTGLVRIHHDANSNSASVLICLDLFSVPHSTLRQEVDSS
jgi:ankyrin repeat protein